MSELELTRKNKPVIWTPSLHRQGNWGPEGMHKGHITSNWKVNKWDTNLGRMTEKNGKPNHKKQGLKILIAMQLIEKG